MEFNIENCYTLNHEKGLVRVYPYIRKSKKGSLMWYVSICPSENEIIRMTRPAPPAKAFAFLESNGVSVDDPCWTFEKAFNNNLPHWRMIKYPAKSVVYFVHAIGSGRVKIGWAKDFLSRLHTLNCDSPFPVEVLLTIPGKSEDEKLYHEMFKEHKAHNEWFTYGGRLREFVEQKNEFSK